MSNEKPELLIKCSDCDAVPAANAEWFVKYTHWWRDNYNWSDKYPLCTACLIEILGDRFMGGGGPTSGDILSITAIFPEDQRGYNAEIDSSK